MEPVGIDTLNFLFLFFFFLNYKYTPLFKLLLAVSSSALDLAVIINLTVPNV